MNRTGPPLTADPPGPGQGRSDVGEVLDGKALLADETGHALGIAQFVEEARPPAAVGAGDVAGKDEERDRIVIGLGHGREGIGQTRPGDEKGDAGTAGHAGVAVGREGRALFVAGGDMSEGGVEKGVVKIEIVNSGNAEDDVGAKGLQGFYGLCRSCSYVHPITFPLGVITAQQQGRRNCRHLEDEARRPHTTSGREPSAPTARNRGPCLMRASSENKRGQASTCGTPPSRDK